MEEKPMAASAAEKQLECGDAAMDWAAIENEHAYTPAQKQAFQEQYAKTLSSIGDNEVVEGTVVSITKREVVINVGFKSEGVLSINEFRYNPSLQVGDKVEVYVENQEDKRGQLILSHRKARTLKAWDRVNQAFENDEIIKGFIKCRTKGGMIVDVFGIEAFLPGSQIDVRPIRDYDVYVEKTMEFKVVKINQEYKNIVVSHKALIEAELEAQKREIISKLEKGQVLEGTVKNITSYGVFVDLGGVDGLVHITDLSWGRVNHPNEVVNLDEKINVVILDFDDAKKRIALGIKQLTPHPWDSLDTNLKAGDRVKGRVVVLADYGAFVEVYPGVEGLIHVSEMSWSQHLRSAQDFLAVGQEIEAQILTLDRDARKMSLGHKQLEENPWDVFESIFTIGSVHEGTILEIIDKGATIALPYGVEGFSTPKHLVKEDGSVAKLDEKLDFKVIDFNKNNRRIIVSHSRIHEDIRRESDSQDQEQKRSANEQTKNAVRRLNASQEKTTLGDISELAALRENMEKSAQEGNASQADQSEDK